MLILVLPVSGGGFVNQLAIMQRICESTWRPDVTLASSGGNVTAYVALAANWKWAGIERISRELNQELFIKPWNSISILSAVIGYFKGQLYNKGLGVENFMNYYFTPETICNHEIWTGTYNKDRRKTKLFCNMKKEDCILDLDDIVDEQVTQSMLPTYASGNIKLISEACFASASIPALLPPQVIENENYVDGCVSGASPLSTLQGALMEKAKNGEPLHMMYVNSVNLDHLDRKPIKNMVDTWHQAASDLVKSQTVTDRMAGYNILKAQKGKIEIKEFTVDTNFMDIILQIQKNSNYTLTEIYPSNYIEISLENFQGYDVIMAMRKSYMDLKCRIWWVVEEEE